MGAARRPELIEEAFAAGRDVVALRLDVSVARRSGRSPGAWPPKARCTRSSPRRGRTSRRADSTELTPEAFDDLIALNLTGTFNLISAFLEPLRAARGDVVLIGSVSGAWPDRSGAAYQASKAAVHAFARERPSTSRHGVRFTSMMPGLVDTAILDQRPEPPTAELRAQMLHPEDVAAACLFVVSLPHRAHVPELTILPTDLQALGRTT